MDPKTIFIPVCAQVFLTLLVWLWMYVERIGAIKRSGADPQELADPERAAEVLKSAANSSDNFENLFEVPVLFYVAAILIHALGLTDSLYLGMASAFVALRAVHSLVHCTSNRVRHRFASYAISTVVVGVIWIRIALQIM